MPHPIAPPLARRALLALAGFLVSTTLAAGADAILEGRVAHATLGTYLGNARVTLGPDRVTFTDEFGHYRFTAVPAGEARVRASYTGLPAVEKAVTLAPGARAQQDFALGEAVDPRAPVRLDAFVVAAAREMSGAALAVNEQRFTQVIKTVASTDAFGDIADGNVGEFVKFLPGVSLGFSGGHAASISVGGMPPESTPIMIDGNRVASATAETRQVQLDQISINNMARVEVVRSQNPDNPASGIGGSVNLIPKSAFERRAATYTLKAYGVFRDHALKRGGPYKIVPNYEVSAIVPLTPRLGFALNATSSETQSAQYASTPIWVPTASATSANLPATTPQLPYLARYEFADSPKGTKRQSAGFSADWRFAANDVLSVGLQYGFFNELLNSLPRDRIILNPGRVVAWGPDFTQGAAGAGSAQLNYSTRDVTGTTYQPNLRWRHNGPVWKLEAGGAFSRSSYHDRNVDKGFWGPLDAYRRNLTIRFDNHNYLRPGGIVVTDAAGQRVDTFKLAGYRLETVGSSPVDRLDYVRSASVHARREFDLGVPVAIKAGFDYGAQTRDLRSGAVTYSHVGADGVAQTADDEVAKWFSPRYVNRHAPWGLPIQEGISSVAVYDAFKAAPNHFQLTAANEVTGFRNRVNGSKRMTEAISAPYLRFDATSLLDRRLTLTGGVRYERTEFEGVGPSINPAAIYQRDAAGNIVRNAAGQPVAIAALASLAGTQLAYRERGATTERSYGNLYPSLNASFQVRPDLVARLSYAKSIARPNLNHILPSLSLPDETTTARTVTLTNPNLEPWEADSYGLALEYYFSERSAGLLSARGYLREIKNFWGAVTAPITAELIDIYGLDPNIYGPARGFVVSTRQNVGDARVTGAEFDYRQNLTFLPRWAEGLAVFANLTVQHLEGGALADFTSFVQKTVNYGVTFNRARFTARVNVNERGRERRALFTGAGVEPGTYEYMAPLTTVNITTEYRFARAYAAYATVRNLFNAPENLERYGPNTPGYAKLRQRTDFRPLWSVGVKATF
ncbi:MAG: TonB-dependent receptor [Opitutaceae bacterium]|nr:TonB-dependent receptor [Opitutaceae bacterium]